MASWAGFTDADLKKLKHQGEGKENTAVTTKRLSDHDAVLADVNITPNISRQKRREVPMYKKAKWEDFKEFMTTFQTSSLTNHTESSPASSRVSKVQKARVERKSPPKQLESAITDSQRLSQPKASGSQSSGNKIPRERVLIPPTESQTVKEKEEGDTSPRMQIKQEADPPDEIDDQEALSREMGNLEKFREQQKMIEEANKQRKALLAKTLSERQKRARQEAAKLAHIQKELQLLDNRLTADVTVIRSRIELASREFLEAQKRYDRAEREFIEAKIDLQKKSEMKEQLTEHLYTIIHQNEVRKAKKLSELMGELEMEAKEEGVQLPELPPLSTFATINAMQALQSPKSPTEILTSLQQHKKTSEISDQAQPEPEKAHGESEKNNTTTTDSELCPVDLSSTEKNTTHDVPNASTENPSTEKPGLPGETADSPLQERDSPKTLQDNSSLSENEEVDANIPNATKADSGDGEKRDKNTDEQSGTESSTENCVTDKDVPSSWTLDVVEIKKEPPE